MLNNQHSASLGKLTGPVASGLLQIQACGQGRVASVRGLSSSSSSLASFCMTTVGLTSVRSHSKMQNHKCLIICGPYCALFGPLDYKVIACLSDQRGSTGTRTISPSLYHCSGQIGEWHIEHQLKAPLPPLSGNSP